MACLVHSERAAEHWVIVVFPGVSASALSKLVQSKVPATLMRFVVRVQVLSDQMVVALPIASHARRTRTRLFSRSILVVAKARARVTARGKPSRTATTMTVIATMRISVKDEAFSSTASESVPYRWSRG